MRGLSLPSRCSWGTCSCGLFRGVGWFVHEVSVQRINSEEWKSEHW